MKKALKRLLYWIELILAMSGYVIRHATITGTLIFVLSILFSTWLSFFHHPDRIIAFIWYFAAEICYIGFIMVVLSGQGLRLRLLARYGEDKGYLIYETVLGILFLHNAASIGYITAATKDYFHLPFTELLSLVILAIPFIAGFLIKILAADAVGIGIYYWKDMFLGRKISEFVVGGPYKYFSNPMYGPGQIQGYAVALWYGSIYGLLAVAINQALIFTFYFLFEKKFIHRTYHGVLADAA